MLLARDSQNNPGGLNDIADVDQQFSHYFSFLLSSVSRVINCRIDNLFDELAVIPLSTARLAPGSTTHKPSENLPTSVRIDLPNQASGASPRLAALSDASAETGRLCVVLVALTASRPASHHAVPSRRFARDRATLFGALGWTVWSSDGQRAIVW